MCDEKLRRYTKKHAVTGLDRSCEHLTVKTRTVQASGTDFQLKLCWKVYRFIDSGSCVVRNNEYIKVSGEWIGLEL